MWSGTDPLPPGLFTWLHLQPAETGKAGAGAPLCLRVMPAASARPADEIAPSLLRLDLEGGRIDLVSADRVEVRLKADASTAAIAAAIETALLQGLAARGVASLHGAAFDLAGAAVLAVGDSGSGKSTACCAALRLGARIVSDDSIVLARDGGGAIQALPFRSFVAVRPASRGLLPDSIGGHLRQLTGTDGAPRWVLTRSEAPGCFVEQVVPDRLWLLSIDAQAPASRCEPVGQAEAFAGLVEATSAVDLFPLADGQPRRTHQLLRDLAATRPAFRVRLGRRLISEPEADLTEILEATRPRIADGLNGS